MAGRPSALMPCIASSVESGYWEFPGLRAVNTH
jgi:hypothetical protein